MKSDEFRAIQAPLKEKNKEAPSAALITLKAQGRIGEGITCKVVFQNPATFSHHRNDIFDTRIINYAEVLFR